MNRSTKYSYYEILNVSEYATKEDIKSAYRKLVKVTHPDKTENSLARNRFLLVQEAYDTLMDEGKRKSYDEHLKRKKQNAVALEDSPYSFSKWDLFWFFIWKRIGSVIVGGFVGLTLFMVPYGCLKYPNSIETGQLSFGLARDQVESLDIGALYLSIMLWSIIGLVLPFSVFKKTFALVIILYPIIAFVTIYLAKQIAPLIF